MQPAERGSVPVSFCNENTLFSARCKAGRAYVAFLAFVDVPRRSFILGTGFLHTAHFCDFC